MHGNAGGNRKSSFGILWLAGALFAGTWFAPEPAAGSIYALDLGWKVLAFTNRPALGEQADIELRGIGAADPTNLTLYLANKDGDLLALAEGMEATGTYARATLDLATTNLLAEFDGVPTSGSKTFDLSIWDAGRRVLLASAGIEIRHNPLWESLAFTNLPDMETLGLAEYLLRTQSPTGWTDATASFAVNLAWKSLEGPNSLALAERARIELTGVGDAEASGLMAYLSNRQKEGLALGTEFFAGTNPGTAYGLLNLATTNLLAEFDGSPPGVEKRLELTIWDSGRDVLLASGPVSVRHNPLARHFTEGWTNVTEAVAAEVQATADVVLANLSAASAVLLAAATNIVVDSVGGPLLEDFATAEFRVSESGWGVMANGAAANHGNVIARENTLGLRENFTIVFTNIRSSVEGGVPTATAVTNLSDGPFSAESLDMAGNTATGLHWSAGVQSGAVGVVECTIGTWTGQASRTFPGYTATTNVHEFLGFVPGSLRATVDADMLARNSTGDINPYKTTATWPNLVRNTNVWTKDMDLTCVSPYNSLGRWTYNFTLVTPQHFVFASHWPSTGTNSSLIDGHTLYFIDSTNGLHSREVVKARQVWMDCSVGLLDAPLPASVTPAKIIDTNDFAKFKGVETVRPGNTLVGPSGMIGVHVRPTYARAVRVRFDPPTPDYNTYWGSSRDPNLRHSDTHSGTNYVGGESGSPVLLCIEGQTVIAQTLYAAGGAGPPIAALRPQIEATMAALGESAHTNLETINLAHWPDYP